MNLKFKSTGSSKFVAWLKGFKDISPSLLLEVDLKEEAFVAVTYTAAKEIVKYSKITFEDAGYEFSCVEDKDEKVIDWNSVEPTSSNRIKCAIHQNDPNAKYLNKVIDVAALFSETDHEMVISFDMCNNVRYINSNADEKEYQGILIAWKSMSLDYNVACSRISENFGKCNDDIFFNHVCSINSPSKYEVSQETISNLDKISNLISSNDRDKIKFYSKDVDSQLALYAFDADNSRYDYLLGYFTEGENNKVTINIFKRNFINAIKGISGDVIITMDTAGSTKMIIDNKSSITVIGAANTGK